MPEWLAGTKGGGPPTVEFLAARLCLAFVFGCVVAAVYVWANRKPRSQSASFVTTLVLLTILIAMVTLVIGNSVARAFSLVGALAIVRFRTVVEDTRDTAFVIFAVVVGMAVGVEDYLLVPLVGIPVVALAALLFSHWGRGAASVGGDFSLGVRLGIGRDPVQLREIFAKYLSLVRVEATETARQGAALDFTYHVRLRRDDDAVAFVTELNQAEGVQHVELRRL